MKDQRHKTFMYNGMETVAFGNSNSDMQMIEYTMAGDGPRMGLIVHHTDGVNEYTYDRKSHFGTLDKALDQAYAHGWIIVDMKKDWNRIFPCSHLYSTFFPLLGIGSSTNVQLILHQKIIHL